MSTHMFRTGGFTKVGGFGMQAETKIVPVSQTSIRRTLASTARRIPAILVVMISTGAVVRAETRLAKPPKALGGRAGCRAERFRSGRLSQSVLCPRDETMSISSDTPCKAASSLFAML